MERTRHIARRATRRIALRDFVRRLGFWLTLGLGVGLLSVGADRLIGPGLPWPVLIAAPTLAGAGVAGLLALRRRRSLLSGAVAIDEALRLQNRLGAAIELAAGRPDDPFTHLAIDDAERAASGVSLKAALPVRWGRSWMAWPVLAGGAIAIGILVTPQRLLDDPRADDATVEQVAQREEADAELESVMQAIDEAAAESSEDDAAAGATNEQLDILDDVREQLRSGEKSPDEARLDAARALEETASELESRSERDRLASDETAERLSGLPTPDGASDETNRLRDALRRGDLDEAIEAADALDRRLDELTPEQRDALSKELEDLASDLESMAEQERAEAEQSQRSLEEALRNQGLDEDRIRDLQNADRADDLREQLEEQGFDEEAARRLAEQIEAQSREREAREQAAEETESLSDAAKQAAEKARQNADANEEPRQDQPSDQQQNDDQKGEEGTGSEGESQREQQSEGSEQPGASSQSESGEQQEQQAAGEEGGEQSGATGEQQEQQAAGEEGGEQSGASGEQQEQQATGEEGGEQSGATGEQQEGASESGEQAAQEGQEGREGAGESGERQPTGETGARESQEGEPGDAATGEPSQDGETGQAAGGEQPQDGEGTQGVREGGEQNTSRGGEQGAGRMDDLKKRLERLKERRGGADQRQKQAEDLRQRAEKMLENMSEDERRELEQWARERQRESAPAQRRAAEDIETEFVDARGEGGGDQPITDETPLAEWYDPDAEYERDPAFETRDLQRRELERAMRSAEEAMEENVIPRRFRNVERYFQRALEITRQAEQEGSPSSEPAPTAPDVERD